MSPILDTSGIVSQLEAIEITGPDLPVSPYIPLDPSKLEIRLLQISPSTTDSKVIHCTQETVSLQTLVFYRALSYEWGKQDDGVPDSLVMVNGCEVMTTPNLRLALKHLKSNAWYWIDALCINQKDPNERGHQVRIMTTIFERAYAVDVWLGLHFDDSHLAMDLIHEADGLDDLIVAGDIAPGLSQEQKYANGFSWIKSKLIDPSYDPHWTALQQLTSRTYWNRLWIIQEIVITPVATRVQLLCGDSQTLFKNLHNLIVLIYTFSFSSQFFEWTESRPSLVKDIKEAAKTVMVLCDHVRCWQARSNGQEIDYHTDITRLLANYEYQKCSDERDRVYALLGVSTKYEKHELPISYMISVDQVYKNTAKYAVEGSGYLDLLLRCRRRGSSTLPSWVPDWRCYNPFDRVIRDRVNGWEAANLLPAITSISMDGNILSTRGYILGKIGDLNPSCTIAMARDASTLRIGKAKLYLRQCLDYFVKASGEEAVEIGKAPEEPILREFHTAMIRTTYRSSLCKSLWSTENFQALCISLYIVLEDRKAKKAEQIMISKLSDLLDKFILRKLCQIDLQDGSSTAANEVQRPKESLASPQSTAGLCSFSTICGDDVVVLMGCSHPLILRRSGEYYKLIDEVYVAGFMDGEATTRFPEVDIRLI